MQTTKSIKERQQEKVSNTYSKGREKREEIYGKIINKMPVDLKKLMIKVNVRDDLHRIKEGKADEILKSGR